MRVAHPLHLLVPYDIGVPYEGLPVPDGTLRVTADLSDAPPLDRMGVLYDRLADVVAAAVPEQLPVVHAPDCMASLGVIAGLQRAGLSPSVLWLDAHGDFNTPATSPSGYVGGMPLAMAVGRGDMTVVEAIGLYPLDERHVVLADARDLDPDEASLLASSQVTVASLERAAEVIDPSRPLYLHLDVDMLDARAVHALRYPARGGPAPAELAAALRAVTERADLAAVCLACTWDARDPRARQTARTARELLDVVLGAAG